jgi:hypothetical protein
MKNPGLGRAFYFLGSYTSKIMAAKQEREHPGSFLHFKNGRWYVLKPRKIISNPRGRKRLVTIYKRVLSIQAQKIGFHRHCDAECKRAGHKYIHDFKPGAKLLGIPDGSFLMLANGQTFRLSDGSMLVSDREY